MAATFLEGFFFGGAAWEAAKQVFAMVRGRIEAKAANQRKFAQDDLKNLGDAISPIFALAIKYYGSPSNDGVAEAKQLAIDLKSFAVKWKTINQSLRSYGKGAMPEHLLISFRKAATFNLSEMRVTGLPLDSGLVYDLQKSTENLSIAIATARYDLA